MKIKHLLSIIIGMFTLNTHAQRIVSVNGTVSEIICAIGLENQVVGVDVTSTYPETLGKIPKVGHNRNLSAEGIIGLNPTLVIGIEGDVKPQILEQLKAANVNVQLFKLDFSLDGAKKLIVDVATYFKKPALAIELNRAIDADLSKLKKSTKKPHVLFIYARGAGTMMVAGTGTSVEKMVTLAGGRNAVSGFSDFKPLTAEALVSANPDIILMFDSGLKSMGGIDGLLNVQGIAETNAGKKKKVVEMDGQFLTGFGPRVGKAIVQLANLITE